MTAFAPLCAGLLLAGVLAHWVYLLSGVCWAVALVCVLRMETLRQPALHASPRALLAKAGWVLLALLLIAASALSALFLLARGWEQKNNINQGAWVSYPDESSSLARLDVRSWTVHAEPPSAVEPDTDRHARWWFATSELLGWAAFPLFALLVLPPLNDVPTWDPRVLIAASISWLAIAVGGVVRHRALRRRTGAPVIGELYELLEAAAPLLAYHHDQFRALPKLELAAGERIKARWVSRGGLRTMRQLQRHLLRHCELAALADRHGWKRIRNGQIRKIGQLATSFSLPTTQHEVAE